MVRSSRKIDRRMSGNHQGLIRDITGARSRRGDIGAASSSVLCKRWNHRIEVISLSRIYDRDQRMDRSATITRARSVNFFAFEQSHRQRNTHTGHVFPYLTLVSNLSSCESADDPRGAFKTYEEINLEFYRQMTVLVRGIF